MREEFIISAYITDRCAVLVQICILIKTLTIYIVLELLNNVSLKTIFFSSLDSIVKIA